MRVVRATGPADPVADRAVDALVDREADHCLLLGIIGAARELGRGDAYLALVEDAGEVVAAAVRTPPRPVVVSVAHDERAFDLLTEDLRAVYGDLPGVNGPSDAAAAFAARWARAVGARAEVQMAQKVHEATAVDHPTGVPGRLRDATGADDPLLVRWFRSFTAEALHEGDDEERARSNVTGFRRLTGAGMTLWEVDGEPVSLACFSGPTPTGIRVGPVYTPPEQRNRGYAGACAAALTQRLLDHGRQRVFLFTDLANPTSNRLYARVGYRPVAEATAYRFVAAS